MSFARTVSMCAAMIAAVLGGTVYALGPEMSGAAKVTMLGSAAVVVGLPLFAVFVHWWVNEDVYNDPTRRPQEYEH